MIEIISNPIEMQSLATAWNELADRSKDPLLRHEWFAAYAGACCQSGQLRIAINNSAGEITAIAPLALVQRNGLAGFEILGASALDEPVGLIYRDEKSLEELVVGIIKMGKPLHLSRLRSKSLAVSVLRRINLKGSCIILRDSAGSPFLPIAASWTAFEAGMCSRHRYNLRRAQKRAEQMGDVQFEIMCPDPHMLDHYLEEIYHVEAAGWKGRRGTAMLSDERLKRFFHIYSRAACSLGILRLCYLRINGKPAAVMLGIELFNRFWILKIGYDEAFSRCSPGILLVHDTIRHAYDNRLEAYEFLGSDAPWIHTWTEQQHPFVTAHIYPFSIRGQFSMGIDTTFALSSKVFQMVRR